MSCVGGGEVAERKLQNLLECGAEVTVVSPEITPGIRALSESGELHWESREYAEGDLKDVFLAIAATDVRSVNKAVAAEAAGEKVILNVADKPHLCTFIAPAIVRRGEVTVAFSTGGASPALARKLRESLEGSDLLEYAELAETLSQARKKMKRLGAEVHPDRWQECISADLVDLVKIGESQQALDTLMGRLLDGSRQGSGASS